MLVRSLVRVPILLLLAFSIGGIASFEALFAPTKQIWMKWTANDAFSEARIDHSAWDEILKRYLSDDEPGLNRFDYHRVAEEDKAHLDRYILGLQSVPISRYNQSEQLAYWINLYNAVTVKVILDHYPVESIQDIDISPGLFGRGPWGKKLLTIEGEDITLNDIEHRILRPIWDDPRIHYAVNCASVGCPNLQLEAFTGKKSEEMLEAAASEFINSGRAAWFSDGELVVSSIYAWFQGDFGGDDAGILSHLRSYADKDLQKRLKGISEIGDHNYDWSLNGTGANSDS